jgi:DNA-binding transcriptional LysR family regulator
MHDELIAARAGFETNLNTAAELGQYTTMLALVSAGLWVGIVPSGAAKTLPRNVISSLP